MYNFSFNPLIKRRFRHQPRTRSNLRCSACLNLRIWVWTKEQGEIDLHQVFHSHRLGIRVLPENIRHNVVLQSALDASHRGSLVIGQKNNASLYAGSRS